MKYIGNYESYNQEEGESIFQSLKEIHKILINMNLHY